MADLLAAQSARKEHWSMQSTRSKLSLGLDIKKTYRLSIGLKNNPFLDNFSSDHCHKRLGAFCTAI
jgi:hypothetical protein